MKRFISIVAAILVLLSAGASYVAVSAQSSASLSIVPKKNYTVEPGKSVKDTLTIRNLDTSRELNLTLRVVDFTYNDDSGAPQLLMAEDAPQTTWSLKPFLTVPKTVNIPPKSSKTLDMNVSIPGYQGAGSYYSAIVYSSGAPSGGNVGLSASGVTLVFTSVPGQVKEDLKLEKLGAYKQTAPNQKGGYVRFATEKPNNIAYTLKNNGNVTESPVGSITLKHMFGKETTIEDINPNSSLALIGQSRTFVSCIQTKAEEVDFNGNKTEAKNCVVPSLLPGRYKITLNAFYGQNGNQTQEISGSAAFWYLPGWFIVLVCVLIGLIAYFIWRTVRKIKGGGSGSHNVRSKSKKTLRRR